MLRICTEQEYMKYVDFVYELALDQSKSGYPTYCDGIKTKEMFLDRSKKAFSRDNEEILLFEYEGIVEGWIHYYSLYDDKYLSTVSFNISSHTEQALKEFLEFAQERFKGYELLLGYSTANTKAVAFLETNGFECIEQNNNNTAHLDKYTPTATSDQVIRITRDNFEYFRKLHCTVENGMYWNSDRIYEDIDRWNILVKLQDGESVGCVYYVAIRDDWFEIFGIDMKDNAFNADVFYDVLGKALNTAKELGGKYMTFFCGNEEQNMVRKLGFECVGQYVCYKKQLLGGLT